MHVSVEHEFLIMRKFRNKIKPESERGEEEGPLNESPVLGHNFFSFDEGVCVFVGGAGHTQEWNNKNKRITFELFVR